MCSAGVWPYFEEDEIQAVTDVLKSGKVNYWGGQQGRNFEKKFAEYHNCQYGVAVANGTVALELALYALDIGGGDDVVTTPKTFLATSSAIVMRGANPVFADVDIVSQNITADSIEEAITPNTKAIICVHIAGWPCEMDKIMALAESHGLYVIEDCAQAHGAEYKGKKVGSWGHISAFSFCQDKIMTTGGEGGMVVTNDENLWQRAWSFKDHGKSYDTVYNKKHPPGFRWLHEDFGTNWRMTEMQAAIGDCQLGKLDSWLQVRREIANRLSVALARYDMFHLPNAGSCAKHSYYKYYLVLKHDSLEKKLSRDSLMADLNSSGVPCVVGSCSEIYNELCFEKNGLHPKQPLKNAQYLTSNTLVLPIHHNMHESQVVEWVDNVSSVIENQLKKNVEIA